MRCIYDTYIIFRMLVTENDQLRTELQEQKRQFEEHKQQEDKDVDHEKLQAQLRHSQDQVRVLKATMEQFLRMGLFSEDASVYQDIASRFSTQLKARYVDTLFFFMILSLIQKFLLAL